MTMPKDTKSYFDTKAATYHDDSTKLLWKWQRSRELKAVSELLGDIRGLSVLDFGCGAGFYTRYLLERGASHVTAIDQSEAMVQQLPKENVTGIVSDAESFNPGKQFDKVICAGLLEFVDNPVVVLRNLNQYILGNGIMVCLVPPKDLFGRAYEYFHKRNGFKINLFSEQDFSDISKKSNFHAVKVKHVFPYSSVYLLAK